MRKVSTLSAVVTSLILHGCIAGGDAGTRIKGRITDLEGSAYKQCTIEILSVDSDTAFNSRLISGEFNEAFVIYPGQTRYNLRFSCDGADDIHIMEKIALGPLSGPDSVVDVGEVLLKRNRK